MRGAALAVQNRYAGNLNSKYLDNGYSVCHHELVGYQWMKANRHKYGYTCHQMLAWLIHDAHEGPWGDMVYPLKRIPVFGELMAAIEHEDEQRLLQELGLHANFMDLYKDTWKPLDLLVCAAEMREVTNGWPTTPPPAEEKLVQELIPMVQLTLEVRPNLAAKLWSDAVQMELAEVRGCTTGLPTPVLFGNIQQQAAQMVGQG
jgi:hypothetical protein